MLSEMAGISFGEDALSTHYSTDSPTDSTSTAASAVASSSSLATSSSTSSSSTASHERRTGGFWSFLKMRWVGFGAANDEKKEENNEIVYGVMECFRNNDVEGMKAFVDPEGAHSFRVNGPNCYYWWDDKEILTTKPILKPTPHYKKIIPSHVRKAVRFDKDYTPEDMKERAFTPLFTSTPKNAANESDDSDEDDLPPLRNCESNTVLPPVSVLNNTSSILLANNNLMGSWNKSRQQTSEALGRSTDTVTAKTYYKVCYDDTDEEEVEDEEEQPEVEPTPRRTFVVNRGSPQYPSYHEESFEMDSSSVSNGGLDLDRLEVYIRSLDDEITAANRFAREKDMIRARIAVRQAQTLQERLGQMNDAIRDICEKFAPNDSGSSDDSQAYGDKRDVSAAFEDSCWAAKLDFDEGSFDAQQV